MEKKLMPTVATSQPLKVQELTLTIARESTPATSGNSVRRCRGNAGKVPGHGSPSDGVACKPVPHATQAYKYGSKSDGRNIDLQNSHKTVDKDPQPDL